MLALHNINVEPAGKRSEPFHVRRDAPQQRKRSLKLCITAAAPSHERRRCHQRLQHMLMRGERTPDDTDLPSVLSKCSARVFRVWVAL